MYLSGIAALDWAASNSTNSPSFRLCPILCPGQCHISAGFGLGWHLVTINGRMIADHTGKDADVMTLAFYIPEQQSGGVIFTDGPDVGHEMIDKILNVIYPDPIYAQTIW